MLFAPSESYPYRKRCFWSRRDIAFLDRASANQDVNIVTIVAWAGVGKSTLIDEWLLRSIVQQSWSLVGPSTDRVRVGAPRPQMNFSTRLSPGLEIQIRGSERRRIANVEVATISQHNGDRDLVDSGVTSGVDYGRSRKKEVASTRHVQKIVTVIADEKGYGKSL